MSFSQDTLIKYEIHDYTLTTDVLYKSDYTIKTFNIIFSETENNNEQIVYFSVLPDLTTGDLWSQIDSIEVFAKQQNIDDLHYLFIPDIGYQENMQRLKRKYFNEYYVVIKEDGKYYKANNSLMELYDIKSVDPIFPSPYGQLNLLDNYLTIQKYAALYKKYFPHYNLPFSNSSTGDNYNFRDGWRRFWREYLSNIVDVYGHKGYKFWTAAASNITHGPDINRGVDRFIYIPKKGIVASSYDFLFKQNYSASGHYIKF